MTDTIDTVAEAVQARQWRENLGLTRDQLGAVIGYSIEAIYAFERGAQPSRPGQNDGDLPHKPWTFLRYKRACGDVDAELNGRRKGEVFGW